jgi:hypothetical protein
VATAEIVRDASTTIMENAAPILSDAIQGSTQEYDHTPNSTLYPTPVFFAPQHQDALATYWGVLIRGAVRNFFTLISRSSPTALASPTADERSFAWDRLSLELMRIASLEPNWDGEGAEIVPQTAVKNAAVLLYLARGAVQQSTIPECPVPSVIPTIDGGVTFKWVRQPKELKCTVRTEIVEVVRWRSPDRYESDGYWEVPVQRVAEHFQWLLR